MLGTSSLEGIVARPAVVRIHHTSGPLSLYWRTFITDSTEIKRMTGISSNFGPLDFVEERVHQ
jgi:hypothetical protein